MESVLALWGLQNETLTPLGTINESAWRIGERYILKYNPNPNQLASSIRIAGLLVAEGIPVAEYLKTTDGQWTTPDGTYCVMRIINGKHVDLFRDDMAFELGQGLACLHLALANIEAELNCRDNDLCEEWEDYIKPSLVNISDEITSIVEERLLSVYKSLPRQPIHRDVHLQNILFDNGCISGWIDFDLTRRDVRIFDLAYLLSGLLEGKTNDHSAVERWKAIYDNLLSGYGACISITNDEREALPIMIIAIHLLFVAFYNKNGNIEGRNKVIHQAEWVYREYKK